jgi:hypothetical protein
MCASVGNDPWPTKTANELRGPIVALLGPVHLVCAGVGATRRLLVVAKAGASCGSLQRVESVLGQGGSRSPGTLKRGGAEERVRNSLAALGRSGS